MAKLLMSCDDYIYSHDGLYYASSQEKFDFYQRYLRVFEQLRLVCRCEERPKIKEGCVLLNQDNRIEVVPVPMFHGPGQYTKRFYAVGKAVRNAALGCDAAVLRIPSTTAMRVYESVKHAGIPYACEVVYDAEDGWRGNKGITKWFWKLIDRQMRVLCNNADGVSCVTEFYLQKHYYSNKPNSFSEHYSSLALDKSFYGKTKEFPSGKTMVIAHISNQVGEQSAKGHMQMIKAIKYLKDRGVDVRVKFAGGDYYGGIGKYKKYACQLGVSDNVEFVGFLNRTEISLFLSEADLYVMPTKAEGLPRVIIEAMAKGLPCITTPVSGNPELVESHFLVDYHDTEELADRIEELTKNADLYEKTSRANYEKSWKYEASVLERRRDDFYEHLKGRIGKRC